MCSVILLHFGTFVYLYPLLFCLFDCHNLIIFFVCQIFLYFCRVKASQFVEDTGFGG